VGTETREGTPGKATAWVLYVFQLLLEALLFLFSAFSVMATDPCGTGVDEPRICSGYYFATAFYGYWAVLLVAAVAVPVMIARAGRRGRRPWVWPVAAMVGLLVATVVYVAVLSQ
jgi:hypothetical protein